MDEKSLRVYAKAMDLVFGAFVKDDKNYKEIEDLLKDEMTSQELDEYHEKLKKDGVICSGQ